MQIIYRWILALAYLLTTACGGGGGGGSTGASAPTLLAELVYSPSFGSSVVSETLYVSFEMGLGGADPANVTIFGDVPIRPGDELRTLTADVTTPGFAQIAAQLTNGVPQAADIQYRVGTPITGVGGDGLNEDFFFRPYLQPGSGDFAGYRITSITLEFKRLIYVSPGRDVNGDGEWTDAYPQFLLRVFGTPE